MSKDEVRKYFEKDSKSWLIGNYEGDGYAYPTAHARYLMAVETLNRYFPEADAKVVDLGCGAGQLCNHLGRLGFDVTGIDESHSMISTARDSLYQDPLAVDFKVTYLEKNLIENGLEGNYYDVVTSFGVIGYLENDDVLFAEANRLLKPGGMFVLSCRNRLFNMVSISSRTMEEVESGGATELIKEILDLYIDISVADTLAFVRNLATVSSRLVESDLELDRWVSLDPDITAGAKLNPRQHCPGALSTKASEFGFKKEIYYGLHPHLMTAGFNYSLPAGVFNTLSSSLDGLSTHPASLVWSSQFIGVFRKIT